MPAFHFDRQGLRRTAWATLLVWLLALAAGVVNACALAPSGAVDRVVSQAGVGVPDAPADEPAVAAHPGHHAPLAGPAHHDHGQGSGNAGCLKFCGDASSAIAKIKPPFVGLVASHLTVAQPWRVIAAAGAAGFGQPLVRPGAQGPPLVIRLLRLAL